MKEVRARGPITIGMLFPYYFGVYEEGILTCDDIVLGADGYTETQLEVLRRLRDGFRPEEHLITIIGWGENKDGVKYWICQNSYININCRWGTSYGDKGTFLVRRGANECAMESDAAALYPKLIKNK